MNYDDIIGTAMHPIMDSVLMALKEMPKDVIQRGNLRQLLVDKLSESKLTREQLAYLATPALLASLETTLEVMDKLFEKGKETSHAE